MSQESNIFNMKTVNYIISAVIIVIIIAAIYKVFNEVFNNAVMKSLADATGSVAYGLSTLFDGCTPQTNCDNIINNPDNCKSHNDCSYDPTNNKCAITTGRKPAEGGFTSASCGLGLGIIVYGSATLIMAFITTIATAVGAYRASPSLKQAQSLDIGTTREIVNMVKNELIAENLKLEKLAKDNPQLQITEKDKQNSLKEIANKLLNQINEDKINTITNTQKAAQERIILDTNRREAQQRLDKELTPAEKAKAEEIKKLLPDVIP